MTDLHALFDPDEIATAIEAKHLSMQTHPEWDLTIFNYTSICQIARAWTPVTSACRGLIVGPDNKVLARPFIKFFNYTETAVPKFALTTLPIVTEKMDGSLGIIYKCPDGRFAVATRGSFMSDQAIWATQWLTTEMPDFTQPDGVTTLVEIIFPENRIVVDYGDRAELVLLGAVAVDTGADIPLWEIDWWPGARTEQHVGLGGMDEVHRHIMGSNQDGNEAEGIVAVWYRPNEPSFRLKVKHPRYVELHALITNTSSRKVWKALSRGFDFDFILGDTPDEFHDWMERTIRDITEAKEKWEMAAMSEFAQMGEFPTRREFAEAAKRSPFKTSLFALLDGKSIEEMAWAAAEPTTSFPFNSLNQGR